MRHALWAAGAVVCVCCIATGTASAQEAVKLEYKLTPGTEIVHKLEGQIGGKSGSEGSFEGTMTGMMRTVVAAVDQETKLATVGMLRRVEITAVTKDAQGAEKKQSQPMASCDAFQVDKAGRPVAREAKPAGQPDEKRKQRAALTLSMLGSEALDCVTLPEGPASIGTKWRSAFQLPFPGWPLSLKAESALSEIRDVDGKKCAVIKSVILPIEKGEGQVNLSLGITGEIETIFDIEQGLARQITLKMDVAAGSNQSHFEMKVALDSVRAMPPEEAAKYASMVKDLAAATAKLRLATVEDANNAVETLQALKGQALTDEWKSAIEGTLKVAIRLQQSFREQQGTIPPVKIDEAGRLMMAAEAVGKAGRWKDAATMYGEVAEKFPDHALAPEALSAAAKIYEEKLNDKPAADAARHKLLALQEKKAAAGAQNPMETYKLARGYAQAGETDKALEAYRKFLALESKDIPGNTRLMAQFQLAGLLEKSGKAQEAVAAYRAAAAMPGDDAYSKKVKEEALKKTEGR